MTDHVVRDGGARALRALIGVLLAVASCALTVLLAVFSFDINPAAPVLVALVAVTGGTWAGRRTHDPFLKGLALGMAAGGLVAVLLWPLFGAE